DDTLAGAERREDDAEEIEDRGRPRGRHRHRPPRAPALRRLNQAPISAAKASSSMISTPRDSALACLDPAFSPATSRSVFFETDEPTLPPAASMASPMLLRSQRSMEPVATTVLPAWGELTYTICCVQCRYD